MFIKKLDQMESVIKPLTLEKLKSGYVVLESGAEIGEHTTDDKE